MISTKKKIKTNEKKAYHIVCDYYIYPAMRVLLKMCNSFNERKRTPCIIMALSLLIHMTWRLGFLFPSLFSGADDELFFEGLLYCGLTQKLTRAFLSLKWELLHNFSYLVLKFNFYWEIETNKNRTLNLLIINVDAWFYILIRSFCSILFSDYVCPLNLSPW